MRDLAKQPGQRAVIEHQIHIPELGGHPGSGAQGRHGAQPAGLAVRQAGCPARGEQRQPEPRVLKLHGRLAARARNGFRTINGRILFP